MSVLVSERLCVQNSRIQDGANILINSEDSANYSLTASLDLIGLDTADNMLMKAIKNAFRIKTLIMWSNNFLYTSVIFHGRHDSIVKVQKF